MKLIKNNKVLINNVETGEKVMVPEDQVEFWKGNKSRIDHLKERITIHKKLSSEALLVISRIAFQLKENQQIIGQQNILQVLSFCGLRLEYITNVLFKNRIYRLRQDPGVEDLGLKNVCYVQNKNENENQADGQAEQKLSNAKNDEIKFQLDTRKKIKDSQKSKATGSEFELKAKLFLSNQSSQDEHKANRNATIELVKNMTDTKTKKKIKKLINILDTI